MQLIYKIYNKTLSYPTLLKRLRFDSVVRHILVLSNLAKLRLFPSKKVLVGKSEGVRIIVSLTSYPKRIGKVDLVVRSLMNQIHQPDKIVLWLSKEQFDGIGSLPKRLLDLQTKGLEIRMVDGNLYSHKKYYYSFKEFRNDYVMLADDDILYPSDTISTLLNGMTPKKVHCSYGSIVRYGEDGQPLPYREWQPIETTSNDPEFFFGSGGGTLMMPSSFIDDIHDITSAIKLAPKADDIWLNTMARLSGLKIEKVRTGLILPVSNSKEDTLAADNISKGYNDVQLAAVMKKYPTIFRNNIEG